MSILVAPSNIHDYLASYCDSYDSPVLGLLELSVGRVFEKELATGTWSLGAGGIFDHDGIAHIADWLRAAVLNNEAWLQNVDDLGRPKKMMKFSSIAQIVQEADKQMIKAAQRLGSVKLVDGDEELYEDLGDGYSIVRLLTPAALDRESAQMQHCIGGGAYDGCLNDNKRMFLSLRDRHEKAHVTMEIELDLQNDSNILRQLQGKQNSTPIQKYMDRLIPFFKQEQYVVDEIPFCGHVVDRNGDWHPLNECDRRFMIAIPSTAAGTSNISTGALNLRQTVSGKPGSVQAVTFKILATLQGPPSYISLTSQK